MTEDWALYEQFGALVRSAREGRGLTQADVAEKLGMSRTSVTNMEQGNQPVSLATLYHLADILDVEPVDLLPAQPTTIEDEISRFAPRMQDALANLLRNE